MIQTIWSFKNARLNMHNRKSHKDASCAFMDGWKVQAVSCAVIFLEILRSAAKEQENVVTEPTADKLYWWRACFCAEACFLHIWRSRKEGRDWNDGWVRVEQIHIRGFVLERVDGSEEIAEFVTMRRAWVSKTAWALSGSAWGPEQAACQEAKGSTGSWEL